MNSNENPQKAQKAQNAQTSQTTVNRRPADVWATFEAQDAPALIDFLVGTVGFLRTAVYEDGGRVAHAQLDWPEGGGVWIVERGGRHAGSLALTGEGDGVGKIRWVLLEPELRGAGIGRRSARSRRGPNGRPRTSRCPHHG